MDPFSIIRAFKRASDKGRADDRGVSLKTYKRQQRNLGSLKNDK